MKSLFLPLVLFQLFISSCKKEPGEGGSSAIKGKVFAKYYDKNFYWAGDSAYAPDIDVYIIYGDESIIGDRQKTSYDGSYKFNFLRTGRYKVYAYSRDSSGAYRNQVNQHSPDVAIIQWVEINKRKQTVEAPDIHIIK